MFDVVWANPERELVGQRKARKEKEKEKKEACSSGSRSIASAETELSVRSRKPQSFMESFRLRKKKVKQELSPSLATELQAAKGANRDNRDRDDRDRDDRDRDDRDRDNRDSNRDSTLTPPSMTSGPSSPPSPSSRGRAGSVQHSEASFYRDRDRCIDAGGLQNRSSQDVDSILSKWTVPNSLAAMLSLEEETELKLRPKESRSAPSNIVQTVLHIRNDTSEGAATPMMPPRTPMAPPQKL